MADNVGKKNDFWKGNFIQMKFVSVIFPIYKYPILSYN